MTQPGKQSVTSAFTRQLVLMLVIFLLVSGPTFAQNGSAYFTPGNIVVSRSVYVDTGSITAGTTVLPPDCSVANCPVPATAVTDSTYPFVFNNDTVDSSFGVTSKIFLDQMTTAGTLVTSLEVPNSSQNGVPPTKDQMVTSFSSKSEMALNLSTDGNSLSFMGYLAPIGAIDVSNANTAGAVDPTNPVGESISRVVAQVDQHGKFRYTLTNAYSGNNGRAAILNSAANLLYTAGNAGNGATLIVDGVKTQPTGIIIGTGTQIMSPEVKAEVAQSPGTPSIVGSFNISQLGDTADKIGKDTNFRGLAIHDDVLYYTKGSGSNGVNTVYFLDSTGTECTNENGIGLPQPGAALPTTGISFDATVVQTEGVKPFNMCILKGFPTILANTKKAVINFPFGIWFASPTVLYVADEGSGAVGSTVANFYSPATTANNPTAGLQKWIFGTPVAGKWNLAYTLTSGLDLGMPYAVPNSPRGGVYPVGNNSGPGGSGFPWAPATDGLRNITGVVNGDGTTVTIYAITSTISGSGDQGADPNKLVMITDTLSDTSLPAESFSTVRTAGFGEVLRGVSFTPGTSQ